MQVFADHLLDAWVVSLSYTPDFYYYHYYIIIIIIIIIVIIIIIITILSFVDAEIVTVPKN